MPGVFLSYRREDSAGWTGRVYDRVRARFGDERVFLDVEAIAPGEDFEDVIARVLSDVDAVVVMIGPSWLDASDGRGRRRLDDPSDHVRREVAAAIDEAAMVVPVLVDGATMPGAGDLPEELRPLVRRNALVVSDIRFEHDVGRLLDMLGGAGLEPREELAAHNLPAEMTSFVGRAVERREVMSLIETNRMVTLTGVGGSGKTRLARRLARDLGGDFVDGAWLVELARLGDSALLESEVSARLGVREDPEVSAVDALIGHLKDRSLLLVLDNCEHMVDAVARLAQHLVERCRRVSILATSREALRVPGEATFHVPPLRVPVFKDTVSARELSEVDAVALFVDRARQQRGGFELTDENAPVVARLCARLDGLPLALELAAAQMRVLTVDQISDRLDDRFRMLTGGARTSLPRHRTLQAAMQWSYDLLEPREQLLLARLSVFSGGFTVEGVEALVAEGADFAGDVVDALGRLVDASLVEVEETPSGRLRYSLLETVRQFAADALGVGDDSEPLRRAHAEFYRDLAAGVNEGLRGDDRAYWRELVDAERDNFRAAMGWSLAAGEAEIGMAIVSQLNRFWFYRGYVREGLDWLMRFAALDGADSDVRAEVLADAAFLSFHSGRLDRSERFARSAAEMAARLGSRRLQSVAVGRMAAAVAFRDAREGAHLYREAVELAKQRGDTHGAALEMGNLAFLTAWRGRADEAEAIAAEAEATASGPFPDLMSFLEFVRAVVLLHRAEDPAAAVAALGAASDSSRRFGNALFAEYGRAFQARALVAVGRIDEAEAVAAAALESGRRLGARIVVGWALLARARASLGKGDFETARSGLEELLALSTRGRLDMFTADAYGLLAQVEAQDGNTGEATRLAATAAQLRDATGTVRTPSEEEAFQSLVTDLRSRLGDETFEELWTAQQSEK